MRQFFLTLSMFSFVGIATAVIYFFIIWVTFDNFGIGYIISISLAYAVSTCFHFLANRHFTFDAKFGRRDIQLLRYMVLWVINYMVTLFVVNRCVEYFGFSIYLGVCSSVLVTTFIGYFLSRYWVFKIKKDT